MSRSDSGITGTEGMTESASLQQTVPESTESDVTPKTPSLPVFANESRPSVDILPQSSRTSSSTSFQSNSSALHSHPSDGRNTSDNVSIIGTTGIAVGTPESSSSTSINQMQGLGILDSQDGFGRKMGYTLQVEAPLLQDSASIGNIPLPASSELQNHEGRSRSNEDLRARRESGSEWTPPGRISRPIENLSSSVRSSSQHSPDPASSPRMTSTGSYFTRRQQQTQDLRSEVDEENRKRRERRTIMVKDGYKIVDGVRAKASSSGVYTQPPASAGASSTKGRHFLPSALGRRKSSGLMSPGDSTHHMLGSAVSGMRSLSMGIETWRKHSVSSSSHGRRSVTSPSATEYDDMLLQQNNTQRHSQYMGRMSNPQVRYEPNASVPIIDLPNPRSPRRESEPSQHQRRTSTGTSMSLIQPTPQHLDEQATVHPSTMAGKNVKGLRLPLSDMHSQITSGAFATSSAEPQAGLAPAPMPSGSNQDNLLPTGLLSPAPITDNPESSPLQLPSTTPALAPALSMGVATKGTRRKPVPSTFATTLRSTSSDGAGAQEGATASSADASGIISKQ
ncbi:hypothetical protein QFC19_006327 [Naganishia cerealis]|uniref:Uncharacterized protein n=1 Tax=Naganishia cerealis TaxID=610337 RepID=A0ACC2VHS5_9TREE|nr:hypothetical protein QFC19_006327 [Naganishia cerealis]